MLRWTTRWRPPRLLCELDLTEPLLEARSPELLGRLVERRRPVLAQVLDRLAEAAEDPHVAGLVAKVGGAPRRLAQAQELSEAVAAFRRSGKPAVAWAETFGELAPATVGYYLAAAFDEVWLQPSGIVGLTGTVVGSTFLRRALDKAGIEAEFGRRHEFKNAADVFLEEGFTPAHREASDRLASSTAAQVVAGIAAGRGLSPDTVAGLVDQGPLLSGEARAAGLVDRLGYRDEVYEALRARVGGPTRARFLTAYRRRGPARFLARVGAARRPVVAVIHGQGLIRQGRSARGLLGGPAMGSDTIAAAFRAAARDRRVGAIVFRVASPGGSHVASDVIWREVMVARRSGKPVVASLGDVAGSGGYFVSMAADAIVADPGTLTGSIGVLGGKLVFARLLDRLGVDHDAVAVGRHAEMSSWRRGFSESERARLDTWLDEVYRDFVAKVAEARGMTLDQVDQVARGRVWTG
ncbi:MAG TPA: S49 family peptidase, partial [Acidimicrobiales bacterium]|nr:S49 family peptidase [Acidimicrobiales bacterium]